MWQAVPENVAHLAKVLFREVSLENVGQGKSPEEKTMTKQPIEIRWGQQARELDRDRYDTGFAEGCKAGFLAACILCGCVFLIAVAAVWGW